MHLNKNTFITTLEQKAHQFTNSNNIFYMGNHIVVGFSGGADSVCLLHWLKGLEPVFKISITACHINHNLRGDESLRDQDFAKAFCDKYNIDIIVKSIHVLEERQQGESIEVTARRFRYNIFEDIASSFDMDSSDTQIATAHTLSDQAETILFRLARGTGLKGLEGIPAIRGRIIRPLLSCSREDIEEYCRLYGLDFITDSSNLSDEYTRNQIRHHVVPVMKGINNGFLENMGRLSQTVVCDNSFLENLAIQEEKRIFTKNGFNRKELLKLNPAISNRIIVNLLKKLGAEVSMKKIKDVLEIVKSSSGAIEVCSGKCIYSTEDYLCIRNVTEKIPQSTHSSIPFSIGIFYVFGGKKVNILLCDYEKYKNIKKISPDILKKALDYDRIRNIAVLRSKENGDRIRLAGHSVTRPLKKIFNEAKIPVNERPYQLVISDSDGPIWVEGFGSRFDAAPTEHSKRIALIFIGNEDGVILQFIEGKDL